MTRREYLESQGLKVFSVNGKLYTNRNNVADIWVRTITADSYTRGRAKYTTSDLIKPAKAVALECANLSDIITDISDCAFRLDGTALHELLEGHAGANSLSEERLYMDVLDILIGTKPDHYDGDTMELSDYKKTSIYTFTKGAKPEWVAQLNVGAHFLRTYGFEVKSLIIHAQLRDWSAPKALYNKDYPQTPFHSVPIELWTPKKTQAFIESRIVDLESVSEAYDKGLGLPDCTPEERWETPTEYAVMKKGRKSALAVKGITTRAEAEAIMKAKGGTHIEERPGKANRCELYCDAYPFCEQAGGTSWQK